MSNSFNILVIYFAIVISANKDIKKIDFLLKV